MMIDKRLRSQMEDNIRHAPCHEIGELSSISDVNYVVLDFIFEFAEIEQGISSFGV